MKSRNNQLGEMVKKLRLRHKLKLPAFAAKLGFTMQYLSQVERGRQAPSINMLAKLIHVYGLDETKALLIFQQDYARKLTTKLNKFQMGLK